MSPHLDTERHAAALSDSLHRYAADAADNLLWLAVDGRGDQARSELRLALSARNAVSVPLRHPQIDERLWPKWYGLNTSLPGDSTLLRLSVKAALEELSPTALRYGAGREVAGWITLPAQVAPAHATARMASQMIQRHAGRSLLLRLHDPAVLWWLWRFLDERQRGTLLHPVRAWHLLDPAGSLTSLNHSELAPPSQTLVLDSSQWADVQSIGALNSVLRELGELPANAQAAAVAFDIIVQAMRRARQHGFQDSADLALYARHAFAIHPRFDSHPRVRALLQARKPEDFYAGLVAEMNEASWSLIQRECRTLNHDES